MATIQELQLAREQIQSNINQARSVSIIPIPERRYGSQITKAVQQDYIKRKQDADKFIEDNTKQIETIDKDIEKINQYNREVAEYEKEQRRQQRRRIKSDIANYERRKSEPMYTDSLGQGISIAPEIAEKRIQEYNKQAESKMSIAPPEVLKKVLKTPQKFDTSNINKLAEEQSKYKVVKTKIPLFTKETPEVYSRGGVVAQTYYLISQGLRESGRAISKTSKESLLSGIYTGSYYTQKIVKPKVNFLQKNQDKVNDFYAQKFAEISQIATKEQEKTFLKTGLITATALSPVKPVVLGADIYLGTQSLKAGYQFVKSPSPQTGANAILNLPIAYSLLRKGYKYSTQKVEVGRDLVPKASLKTATNINTITKNGKNVDVVSFTVTGRVQPRYAYVVPRYQRFFTELKPIQPTTKFIARPKTFGELSARYPSLEKVMISKPQVAIATIEKAVARNGELLRSATRDSNKVFIVSSKGKGNTATISQIKTSLRGDPIQFDKLKMNRLTLNERKALSEIFNVKRDFPAKSKVQTGTVKVVDVAKVNFKNKGVVELIKNGRRQKAELVTIQKDLGTVNFERQLGLKEFSKSQDFMGVVDVTKLRFRTPKKADLIVGTTERKVIDLPSSRTQTEFIQGIKPIRTLAQERALFNQLYSLKAGASIKVINDLKVRVTPSTTKSQSLSSPSSQITKSSLSSIPVQKIEQRTQQSNIQRPVTKVDTLPRLFSREVTREVTREIPREISREVTRNLTRDITREIQRPLVRQIERSITREIQRPLQRQITRQAQRNIFRPFTPRTVKTPKTTKSVRFSFKSPKYFTTGETQTGYVTFIKRKGKFFNLPGIRTRDEALQFGENKARKTLSATFGIKPTKIKVRGFDTGYKVSSQFRDFQIKEGKKLSLKDTFIQKLGKRLSSGSEVRAIQMARLR